MSEKEMKKLSKKFGFYYGGENLLPEIDDVESTDDLFDDSFNDAYFSIQPTAVYC